MSNIEHTMSSYWHPNTNWGIETQWQWCDIDGRTTARDVGYEVAWVRGKRIIRSTKK